MVEPMAGDENPMVVAEIGRLVDEVNAGLPGAERILSCRMVSDDAWTPDSDGLTATGKMRRCDVAERYQDLIDEMYQNPSVDRARVHK